MSINLNELIDSEYNHEYIVEINGNKRTLLIPESIEKYFFSLADPLTESVNNNDNVARDKAIQNIEANLTVINNDKNFLVESIPYIQGNIGHYQGVLNDLASSPYKIFVSSRILNHVKKDLESVKSKIETLRIMSELLNELKAFAITT